MWRSGPSVPHEDIGCTCSYEDVISQRAQEADVRGAAHDRNEEERDQLKDKLFSFRIKFRGI